VPLPFDSTVQDAPVHEAKLIGVDPDPALSQEAVGEGVVGEGVVGVEADAGESTGSPSLLVENFGSWLMVAGVGALIVILFRNLRKLRRKTHEMDRDPRDRIDEIQDRVSGINDMHGMTARAQESVQTLITQLENKAARLEVLLDKTEARIAEFDARLNELDSKAAPSTHPPTHQTPRLATHTGKPPYRADADTAPPIDPLHKRVHALADQGLDSVEIARQINRPTGQVDLILALRRA